MIHSVRFTAVLDINVIYPIIIRDLLFWFAHYDLYTPKWSNHIFMEWKEVMLRKGIEESEADKRINTANMAFPDALVSNYESLIQSLELPDEYDVLDSLRKVGLKHRRLFALAFMKNMPFNEYPVRLINLKKTLKEDIVVDLD